MSELTKTNIDQNKPIEHNWNSKVVVNNYNLNSSQVLNSLTSSSMPFVKMHGLGNDFVIVDKQDLPENCNNQELAKKISHPHTGIGADQFIVYNQCNDYVEMFIYNQDGSIAEACGNASRCLTSLINKKFNLNEIIIQIKHRKIPCTVEINGQVNVNMGIFSFDEKWMLSEEKLWEIAKRYSLEFKEIVCVDIANPHLVIFSNLSDQDKYIIGEQLQSDEFFKNGVNVNFASIMDNKIHLKVWERGTGFTLACGSGACASFAAAKKLGFVENETEVVFELGSLKVKQVGSNIIMAGSTTFIAEGLFYL